MLSRWTRRSTVSVTPRSSSELVLLVRWKSSVRTRSETFLPGCSLELEAGLQNGFQEASGPEDGPVRLPESHQNHDDCQDLVVDADLAGHQAQPQVYTVWQVQERI